MGKVSKQVERYEQAFGEGGAIVFGQGYCADLQHFVPSVLLLDASPLDMSAVTAFQEQS